MITFLPDLFASFLSGLVRAVASFPWTFAWYLFASLDLFLAVLSVTLFFDGRKFRPRLYFDAMRGAAPSALPALEGELRGAWQKILERAEAAPPQSLTLGIIEADGFVDDLLKRVGLAGDQMSDRLKRLRPEHLKSLDALWRAHRVRNDLVHTPGFYLSATDARTVLEDYEAFLIEMQAI